MSPDMTGTCPMPLPCGETTLASASSSALPQASLSHISRFEEKQHVSTLVTPYRAPTDSLAVPLMPATPARVWVTLISARESRLGPSGPRLAGFISTLESYHASILDVP